MPTVETQNSEIKKKKKTPFKTWLLIDNAAGYPRVLMEIYNKIIAVFIPDSATAILQPIDQE